VIHHQTAGAGGYGPPHERDPALLRVDLVNGKVTAAAAMNDYGTAGDNLA
jgi:N-methylhydantoinase B/oxoprolinase/acetone carboxylase alpha subunit